MPTLTIGDRKVKIDDSFLALSPDEQNAAVEEISKSLGAAPSPAPAAVADAPAAAATMPAAPAMPARQAPVAAAREAIPLTGADPMGNIAGGEIVPADVSQASMPYADQLRKVGGAVDDSVRAVANGVPFMDRFAAGAGALTGIGGKFGDYSGNLAAQRAEDKRLDDAAPIANGAAHLLGGALVPLGAAASAARGTSLLAKSLMGLGTGAGLGAVQGVSEAKDLTDTADVAKHGGIGLLVGGATGAGIPLGARAVGMGYNAAANYLRGSANGMARPTSKILSDALMADGMPAVRGNLDRLGPEAMLADAGPAFLGKAQGASLNSDEGRSILQNALMRRNEGTNARIQSDVNRVLGPAEDPQTVTNTIRAYRTEVDDKAYPAAFKDAPAVDLEPVMANLVEKIGQSPAGSMEHRALTNLQKMLTKDEPAAAAAAEDATTAAVRGKYGDTVADAYAKQGAKAATEKPPQSLLEFITSKGGLGPDVELEAIGGLAHTVNVEGLGRRKLVKQGGLPLDYAREAAEEAGYLQGSHKGTSTVSDLLDAIDAEMRGRKLYPQGFEGHVGKRQNAARSEREQHEYDRMTQGLEDDLEEAGHGQIGADVKARAIDLMRDKGLHADDAVDRAVRQLENESSFPGNKPMPGSERGMAAPAAEKAMPHDSANLLHKVKGELDNIIEYDAPGLGVPAGALQRQQAALKQMRFAINDALETQVPGYAAANRQSAALARRGQAVELGTQYLGNGKTTASPGRFEHEFEKLEPGEQIAFAKGSRGNIDRVLGTKANDLQALRSELQGEGGWNTAKIGTVHGQEAANELAGSVDRNLHFRDTYNKVVENSQTAQRQAAANAMKPDPAGELTLISPHTTAVGLLLAGGKKGAAALYNRLRPDDRRYFGEVAEKLTQTGSNRDATLNALADALIRRTENSAQSMGVGNRAALAAALVEHEHQKGRSRER